MSRPAPRELAPGWPDRPAIDPAAEIVRQFALALRDALDGRSLKSVSADTGVTRTTLRQALAGEVWVDALTLARLESGLGRRLWPGTDR